MLGLTTTTCADLVDTRAPQIEGAQAVYA